MLKAKHEDTLKEEDALRKALRVLLQVMDELQELKGERDAVKEEMQQTWWKDINWKEEDNIPLFDALKDETKQLIIDAGLCPHCGGDEPRSEAERAMSHFKLTEEEWGKLSDEEKQEYIDKLPPRGSGGEEDETDDDEQTDDGEEDPSNTEKTTKKKEDSLSYDELINKGDRILASVVIEEE